MSRSKKKHGDTERGQQTEKEARSGHKVKGVVKVRGVNIMKLDSAAVNYTVEFVLNDRSTPSKMTIGQP